MAIKFKAPEGIASISIDGNMFVVDGGGYVVIPREYHDIAVVFGCVPVDDFPDFAPIDGTEAKDERIPEKPTKDISELTIVSQGAKNRSKKAA